MSERKVIGILGGLGPASTVMYYEHITRRYHERFGDSSYPQIVIYSYDFQAVIDAGYRTAGLVRDGLERLAAAGADFAVAACNSIHVVYDEVTAAGTPLPWLSIMQPSVEAMKAAGVRRAALLGTQVTMSGRFWTDAMAAAGIECMLASDDDRKRIDEIIFKELVFGQVEEASRQFARACMARLADAGTEAVILGCTELPLLIKPADCPEKLFDTAWLHAEAALEIALGERRWGSV